VGLKPSLKADLALLGVAAIWGATFVVVKRSLDDASPFVFISLRFLLGAAAMGIIYRRRIFPVRLEQIRDGSILGLFIGAGFAFQTFGLLFTTPARSAFITGLYVVGVPLLAAALGRRGLNRGSLIGVILALSGLWLMTGAGGSGGGSGLGRGETLTLFCTALFAAHIVGVDIYTRRHDPMAMAFWQVAFTGVACVPLSFLAGTPRLVPTAALAGGVVITGLGATALALGVQNAVQSRTTPTRTAIIFTMEPVFAGLTSFLVGGEILSATALAGGALIIAGMLAAEIPWGRPRHASPTPGSQTT
jgi:drug/metabolite transporter (DMT)-like permease